MRAAWFLVQGWSNFQVIVNEFCCPTELLVPIWGQWKQQLVIHNYCQSQISFPAAPGVHFCPSNNTEGIPEAWSPTLLTIQSERWFWSSRRYIQTTNIYEWKSVAAFIFYWMSVFRDHPKPYNQAAFGSVLLFYDAYKIHIWSKCTAPNSTTF